jgi:RNA polymerase sigma-70 factor, ECF subfamily
VSSSASPSSDALLLAAGKGDQDAFAHLYDRLVGPVQVLVRGFVQDTSAVDTVTAAVMLEAWRTAPSFDPSQASASRWVLALARTRSIERVTAGRLRRIQVTRAARRVPGAASDPLTVEVSEAEQLLEALATLPAMHRHALQLAFHGRAGYGEVARLLETSPGEVLIAMRAGLRQLRLALGSPSVVVIPSARAPYS